MSEDGLILRVEGLEKRYPIRRGLFGRAGGFAAVVRGVSFGVRRGQILGLVGESGSGKTTTARLIARLEPPDAGRIFFQGVDWLALSEEELRGRRRDMQIVFQDPYTSLNPRMRAGDQVAEPLRVQRLLPGREIRERVAELLA
ncbi:MAG TPA: ATP-binding cassette domain-containing protein, partial [Thermoanaerobaculia bacterium]|nr:ATP-binding cassette domain-containing protein [Thermoanaerobaculia bacterium]